MRSLQQSLGNQAIQRLSERGDPLAKLDVSKPNDKREREAEQIAGDMIRMPEAGDTEVDNEVIPRTRTSPATRTVDSGQEQRIRALLGGGRPLPNSIHSFFEPRFGYDFGGVRVHMNDRADEAARSLNAKAFTIGRHVAFRSGAYHPTTKSGKRLVAHELAHVVQRSRDGRLSGTNERIMPYRPKGSANFGVADAPPDWVEKPFESKEKDPWIEKITVNFTGHDLLGGGSPVMVPTGTLTAKYYDNSAKRSPVTVDVVGGKASAGYSNEGTHTVKRIEGLGYHHKGVPKEKRIEGHRRAYKYFKKEEASSATMNFAVFFTSGGSAGNQAIHYGPLSVGSLACVHVSDAKKMRQMNYHSVKGRTKVEIRYDSAAKTVLCCARYRHVGYMVSNPCGGIDPSKCNSSGGASSPSP